MREILMVGTVDEVLPVVLDGHFDRLKQIVAVAPAMIYIYDHQLNQNEYSNRNIGESLGYSPREIRELGQDLMLEVLHKDDTQRVFEHFAKIKASRDHEALAIEYRMRHKDGYWVWLLSHESVFKRNADGEVTHHIGVAVDISAQKKAEHAAQAATQREASINNELREFSYSISHDLKSPANTLDLVLNEIEVSQFEALDELGRTLFKTARQSVRDMHEQIENVLDYTYVIGLEPEFEPIDLSKIVKGALRRHRSEIKLTQANIVVKNITEVVGHRAQLQVLFNNLISNALKFRKKGGPPDIKISSELQACGQRVQISIADNGVGIPPTKLQEIFTIFKRAHSRADFQGTGVGLAVCKRVAMNHGSDIQVQSTLGEGTVFSFTLERP